MSTMSLPPRLPHLNWTQKTFAQRAPGPKDLLPLIACGAATSKADLVRETGLARSTISDNVDLLLRRGVIETVGVSTRGRGRPAQKLAIASRVGLVAIADIGARMTHLALSTVSQQLVAHERMALDVRQGAPAVLDFVANRITEVLEAMTPRRPALILSVGLPARVNNDAGVPVRPGIMPGWDNYPVAEHLEGALGCQVIVENDTNLRAVGEAAALPADQRPILAIKIATGIGAGLVTEDGTVYHGFDGAAGELGHLGLRGAPALKCSCGNVGCLEAAASIPAILGRLGEADPGGQWDEPDDLFEALSIGDPTAIAMVRSASANVGEAVAMICNVLNPRRVVVGGRITTYSDETLAAIRTVAYQMARPLATRNLVIAHSVLGDLAGVAGATVLGVAELLRGDVLLHDR